MGLHGREGVHGTGAGKTAKVWGKIDLNGAWLQSAVESAVSPKAIAAPDLPLIFSPPAHNSTPEKKVQQHTKAMSLLHRYHG